MAEYPSVDRDILAAGIEWLYRTEQPEGAIIQHHGISLSNGERYYEFCASAAAGLPVIVVNVSHPAYKEHDRYALANPLTEEEVAVTAEVIVSLGAQIREQWNGAGCVSGSFGLTEEAHPSLVAAQKRYHAGCPEHGGVFCACTWYADGNRLIVMPARDGAR